MKKFDYYSLSFKGRRESNQDSCLAIKPTEDSLFLAVADGMGGAVGGQIASKIVIESAKKVLELKFNSNTREGNLKDILRSIFFEAQKAVAERVATDQGLRGMGTTLACALIHKDRLVWGNIGDSRIYHLKENNLIQISVDHTHVQEYKDNGEKKLSNEIIQNYSHYLTRSIDGGEDEPDIFPDVEPYMQIEDGEALLLCSDGLIIDKLEEKTEIFKNNLIGFKELEDAAKNLISIAFQNGSQDNISVVIGVNGHLNREKKKIAKYPFPPTFSSKPGSGVPLYIKISVIIIPLLLAATLYFYFEIYNKSAESDDKQVVLLNDNKLSIKDINLEARLDSIQNVSPAKLLLYQRKSELNGKNTLDKKNNISGVDLKPMQLRNLKPILPIDNFYIGYFDSDKIDRSISGPYYFFLYEGDYYLLTEGNMQTLFTPLSNEQEAIEYAELLLKTRGNEESDWVTVWNERYNPKYSPMNKRQNIDSLLKLLHHPISSAIDDGNMYRVSLITHDLSNRAIFYRRFIEITKEGLLLHPIRKEVTYDIEKEIGNLNKREGN